MIYGASHALRLLGFRARALLCPLVVLAYVVAYGTGVTTAHGVPGNAWDLFFTTLDTRPTTLIWMPLFCLVTARGLTDPAEAAVVVRSASRQVWWLTDFLAVGIASALYATALGLATIVAGLFLAPWSWQWSAFAHSSLAPMPAVGGLPPLSAALEATGLLTLGLWGLSALAHALTLWWRSQWLGLVVVIGAEVLPWAFLNGGGLIRWLPGIQFVLHDHGFIGTAPTNLGWSVAYGLWLLFAVLWFGMARVGVETWPAFT